ncbi:Crp/Fnr family transcriptional regulator [Sphingobium sp. BHU LFT2]|uniref:Crp/Fnr family transcriptional regulator n=1 Tax=Sphingobium sp. BHU LFT2 TaxID=2807634 RepID=UPI001BECBB44|nr:Crp/Fnr family transcriptional regulator [Sphingobium sp. BHU LFT2]MBT2245069.1 Crp/Fnr family transcriptional regulator [Sphingobium sp. BHU LFT2]
MLSQIVSEEDLAFFRPHEFLVRESQKPKRLFQLLEGWACRYRMLPDGRRQITALYLPGDFCEPHWALGRPASQSIVALTNIRARSSPCEVPTSVGGHNQQEGFWNDLLDGWERQSSWLVTLGRRTALERLSHLLLELFARMRQSGLTYGSQCALPLTQMDIADLTGLTPVHVNRTLQTMRSKGLVELQSKWLRIPDMDALRQAAAMSTDSFL